MTKELNRKALYDLVWSRPMSTVAKEYGLSDRGLAKLCQRNSIPVPPRGYWAKKAAGQPVKKAPLIILESNEPETAILLKEARPVSATVTDDKKEKCSFPGAIQDAICREALPENRIKVPTTLHSPHPLVANWIKTEEHEIELDRRYGRNRRSPITPLDRRKWKITSCLFKQLEARGFKIVEEGGRGYQKEIWIKFASDKVSFFINERIRQYLRELTAKEKEDRYSSNQKWTQEKENTGKLEIILAPGGHSYSKIKIQESDDKLFEGMLNEVVIQVIETMWKSKCARLEKEERERQQRKEESERYERKKVAENEQKRKLDLEYKALSWKRSQLIREYIAAVVQARELGQLRIDDIEFSNWLIWANAHANETDFITNGNPLIRLSGEPENLFGDYPNGGSGNFITRDYSSEHPWRKWYHR